VSEVKRDYKIGYGKPPVGRRFQKGQSGNPRGPRRKDLSSLLVAALNEPVYATIDGSGARSPSARRSSPRWSTNRRAPICARPRCCST